MDLGGTSCHANRDRTMQNLCYGFRDKGLALESMSGEDPGLPQIKFHVETRRCGDRVAHPHRERSLGRYKFIPVEPD
jgi:hypothetical protein